MKRPVARLRPAQQRGTPTRAAVSTPPRLTSSTARSCSAVELPRRHAARDHARRGDDRVEPAPAPLGLLDRRAQRLGVGTRPPARSAPARSPAPELRRRAERVRQPRVVLGAVERDHVPAVGREPRHGRRADPARGAGDERDPLPAPPSRRAAPAAAASRVRGGVVTRGARQRRRSAARRRRTRRGRRSRAASSARPSSADAPARVAEHAVRADRAHALRAQRGISSASGATLPASRAAPTSSGASASMSEVSIRPAWASPSQRGRPGPHVAPLDAQFPHRRGERLGVAAVRAHEQHAREPDERASSTSTSSQRVAPDRERPREARVLAARPVRQRRRDDRVRAAPTGASAQAIDRVGAQRQVRPVLLGRAERHDEQIAGHRARARAQPSRRAKPSGIRRSSGPSSSTDAWPSPSSAESMPVCAGRRARSRRRPGRRRRAPTGTARPIITARAPSASALTTSLPRRTPPSSSTSAWSPTASTIARQRADRRRRAVEVVAAVVGDRQRGGADVLDRAPRVVDPHHALEHERPVPQRRAASARSSQVGGGVPIHSP